MESMAALQPPLSPFGGGTSQVADATAEVEEVVEEPEVVVVTPEVRPEYVRDLEQAEAAERDLATGRGFINSEGGADAPSDPVDNLRHALPVMKTRDLS